MLRNANLPRTLLQRQPSRNCEIVRMSFTLNAHAKLAYVLSSAAPVGLPSLVYNLYHLSIAW